MDWRRHVVRVLQLYVGLALYGLGSALQIRGALGLAPWDVFHQGVSRHSGLEIGTVSVITGATVLLLWIPLRERPGLGTVSNVFVVGLSINVGLAVLPEFHAMALRIFGLLSGVLASGIATGLYIGAHHGPGPRDGLMTGLARRTGRSIRLVRTAIEVVVLGIGWLLGGSVGIGTVLYAVAIGPLAQLFLPIFDPSRRRSAVRATVGVGDTGDEPVDPVLGGRERSGTCQG